MFSIGYVVFERAEFRVYPIYPQISAFLLAAFISWGIMHSGSSRFTARTIIGACVIYWAVFSAFFIPAVSPLLVINSFLVLLSAIYLSKNYAVSATMLLILGTEIGYITAGSHSTEQLLFLAVHLLSLVLIVLFGAWYQSKVELDGKRATEETEDAKLERERLQALINGMTDGVVAINTEGRVAVYNGSSLDILNVNASLEGKVITDFMDVIDVQGKSIDILGLAREHQGYLVSRDYLLNLDEYENMNLYISISPVKIGFGHENAEGFIILLRDITREKSLEEERDEFISVVSHELRTPITIAEGNISNAELIAEKEKLPKEVNESLDAAHKQVVFLSDMINDLATLSRADRGKLKEEPEDIDINEFVRALQRDYRSTAQQKGIEFKTHVERDVTSIFSSRLYVREILQNFISNAIKYTQEGDVELSVKQNGARVEFSVRDSGIGISKSDQKHLFKKFFRSEDYRTRENNGTGLGLYVTMKLAKLINAQIGVKSELNTGSTFSLTVSSLKNKHVDVA